MSLRRFQGWEPATSYRYDGDRLVSSVAEPEWDDEQQGWVLALAALEDVERADTCTGCNGRLSETAAQDRWGRALHTYKVQPPTRCNRCTAVGAAQQEAKDLPFPQALHFTTVES